MSIKAQIGFSYGVERASCGSYCTVGTKDTPMRMVARIDQIGSEVFEAGFTLEAGASPTVGSETSSRRFKTRSEAKLWIEQRAKELIAGGASIIFETSDSRP